MNTIGRVLSKPAVFGLSLLLLAVFILFAYPVMGALMLQHTPEGAAFDTVLFYTPEEAVHKASLYEPASQTAMIRLHWTYDLVFPLVYGFFSLSAWALGLSLLAGIGKTPRFRLLLIPMAAVVFDLVENASISIMLAAAGSGRVAAVPEWAAVLASFTASGATLGKWIFVVPAFAGAVILLVLGLVVSTLRRHRNRTVSG